MALTVPRAQGQGFCSTPVRGASKMALGEVGIQGQGFCLSPVREINKMALGTRGSGSSCARAQRAQSLQTHGSPAVKKALAQTLDPLCHHEAR